MREGGLARQRILVIDDDEVMRELLTALLGVQGYEVVAVGSGEEGLQRLREPQPPLLLLTDLQMPGLEGEALTSALREAAPPAAVLIGMSGRKPNEAVLRPLDGFLAKPFDARTLQQAFAAGQEAKAARSAAALLAGAAGLAPGLVPDRSPGTLPMAAPAPRPAGSIDRNPESHTPATHSPATHTPDDSKPPILDEGIFLALTRSFQQAQLGDLYELTVRDVQQRHRRMEASAAEGGLEAVQREAHAIKGACGMVGARELQHLASLVESGDTLHTSAIAAFPAAWDRLERILSEKLQQKW